MANFVVVTYWWGRGNLNHNTQRPCPFDTKCIMRIAQFMYSNRKTHTIDEIRTALYNTLTESELNNESIDIQGYIDVIRYIGNTVKVSKGQYTLMCATDSMIRGFSNANLMNGLINTRRNPFTALGRSKSESYHQDASDTKLCRYSGCYQFPITFEEMIRRWERHCKKAGVQFHTEEYKIAPRDYPKDSQLGKYDFPDNQTAMNWKGEFILKMLNKFKKPVVYMDGDMLLHRYPRLFDAPDFDFMLRHWAFDPLEFPHTRSKEAFNPLMFETSGGIMYFNYTHRAKNVLKGWNRITDNIHKRKQPGADDRILTMYLHQSKALFSCRWMVIPSTYLWLTDKYSLDTFTGRRLPKELGVVIDHPNCLTTEEMASKQGAVMNKFGSRYPKKYYTHVKMTDHVAYPFTGASWPLADILNSSYRDRLFKLLKSPKTDRNAITQRPNLTDVKIDKSKVVFMATPRGNAIKNAFEKHPTKKQFMEYIARNPFVWMASRISV